jgi:glycosyltransferase involved in cell wall biosynthesis
MSEAARTRLEQNYDLHDCPTVTIPHGARLSPRTKAVDRTRPIILTWGLLGPGKGLEQGIRAMTGLRYLNPKPLYVIAGQTHPNVLRGQGERYRNYLRDLAADLGVDDMVKFVNSYLTTTDLASLWGTADLCLFPYESREQVTSGALVEALGAGLPVVATRFPHAVELISDGAGQLVDHGDPAGIAAAIERLLTDPRAMAGAQAAVDRVRPAFSWTSIAESYESLMVGVGAEAGAA